MVLKRKYRIVKVVLQRNSCSVSLPHLCFALFPVKKDKNDGEVDANKLLVEKPVRQNFPTCFPMLILPTSPFSAAFSHCTDRYFGTWRDTNGTCFSCVLSQVTPTTHTHPFNSPVTTSQSGKILCLRWRRTLTSHTLLFCLTPVKFTSVLSTMATGHTWDSLRSECYVTRTGVITVIRFN